MVCVVYKWILSNAATVNVETLCFSFVASFLWVRDVELRHPEHMTLICATSLVACLLLVATLLFVALLFCLRRRAFTEAFRTKRSAGVEYSDYDERVKERRAAQRERQRARGGKRRSGFGAAANGSRPAPSEYAAHEHL